MGYTPLPVKNLGDDLTADDWNNWIRENFLASPAGLAQAKGDLFPASGADAVTSLPAGTNGQIIESDSNTGLRNSWAFIPVGGIILWAGSLGSLPANWQLCDGSNGTPNLRDKFIIGAGGSYAVGATGGANTANLQHNHGGHTSGNAGAHTHTQPDTGAGSAHNHTIATGGHSGTGSVYYEPSTPNEYVAISHAHQITTQNESAHVHNNPDFDSGGSHNHTITVNNQLSSSQDIRPPYYALAYIMRMS